MTSIPTSTSLVAQDSPWLGGKHDGFPLVAFQDYRQLREPSGLERLSHSAILREIAAVHQSWLTFGLIEAVVERNIPESLLIQQDASGKPIVSSRNLRLIVLDAGFRIYSLSKRNLDADRQWLERAEKVLEQAHATLLVEVRRAHLGHFAKAGIPKSDIARILFMIAVIGEAMTFVMHQFVAHAKKGFKWTFVGAFDEGRNRAMMMKGWCPFTMRILQENMCTAGYASTCKPYVRQGAGLSTHDSCSSDGCIVNTIDTSNYSNRHIDNSCQCTHSRPSLEGVVSKLDNWQIPVVSFHCGSSASNTSDLSCVSALDTPFVAISHVWADGLGSTTEHGLPMCQVQRLEILVRQLRVNGGAFWIDALCIPERNESRKRAIGLMGQTYKNAAAVLVIDSGIRTCSVSAPLEEKLLRVLTSGWMQRVWTLQEALLAKKLAFEFSDGLLTIDELLPQGRDTLDFLKVTLVIEIMRLLKRQEYGQLGESFGLGDVARSLRWRTTSRLSDETLAISSLLDVDAYELAGLPANERMKALLLRVGKVASNIIFLSGPKIDSPGFQWAPATFMVRGARAELNTTRKDAICTPAGLISKYAYIAFKQTTFEAKERWCLRENSAGPKFSVDDSEREDSSGSRIAKDYTCSALLFDGSLPKPHQMQGAVAVLAPASCCDSEAGRETRMECVYIRRVLVTWLVEDEVKRHAGLTTLDIQSSGTLEFCIS